MPKIEIPIVELRKRKLFVATPMYGGQCAGPFTKCCLDLNTLCLKHGIDVQFFFLFNESLITRARNYLVDEFLRSTGTHLMFIDSDIGFNPMDVLALLALDKDVIGGPYPKKTIAWERVFDAAKMGLADNNPNQLEKFTGDYVFNAAPGSTEIKMDEPAEVLEIGTGFMMVSRPALERFKAAYPELQYKPDHNRTAMFDGSRYIHMYFQALIDPVTERYLSEDYMFCQWARNAGLKVYLCPWMQLTHVGTYVFGGTMDALAALSQKQAELGVWTPIAKGANEKAAAEVTLPPPPMTAAGIEIPPDMLKAIMDEAAKKLSDAPKPE
jgi:hypothetical protein